MNEFWVEQKFLYQIVDLKTVNLREKRFLRQGFFFASLSGFSKLLLSLLRKEEISDPNSLQIFF